MQLKTLLVCVILVLLLGGLVTYGILHQYREIRSLQLKKEQEEKEKRAAALAKQQAALQRAKQKQTGPDALLAQARSHEARGDWRSAAEYYEKAAKVKDSEETKRHLRGARLAAQGLQLEEQQKWDEALTAYQSARDDINNKNWLDDRVKRVKKRLEYLALCEKGTAAHHAGNFAEAVAAFDAADRLARELMISSDARKSKREAELAEKNAQTLKADLSYLLKLCEVRQKPCAAVAVCSYAGKSKALSQYAKEFQARRAAADDAIKGNPKLHPPMRAEMEQEQDVILLKNGTELRGKIVGEIPGGLKLQVRQDDKLITRLIAVADIEKRSKDVLSAAELNTSCVEDLFRKAVRACDKKEFFEALNLLGEILHTFPNADLLKDKAAQAHIITEESKLVSADVGKSFDKLLDKAVLFCSTMCEYCNGIGSVPCTHCDAKGEIRKKCDYCNETGKETCIDCAGRGKIFNDLCASCAGTGKTRCPQCGGKRYVEIQCLHCDPDTYRMVCPVCHGKQKRKK